MVQGQRGVLFVVLEGLLFFGLSFRGIVESIFVNRGIGEF